MHFKKIRHLLLTGLLTGTIAFSSFACMPVMAEHAYTGIIGQNLTFPNTVVLEDGASMPAISGISYSVTSVSNPHDGASGNPTIANVATTANSASNVVNSTISLSGVTFSKPGEYIWQITPGAITSPGVDRIDTAPQYLHVFVVDNNGSLQQSVSYLSSGQASGDHTEKGAGFRISYDTVSLTVSKAVSGNAGDKAQSFAFRVDLTGCNPGTTIDGTVVAANGTWSKAYSLTHGEQFTLNGIPVSAGYTVTETGADDYSTVITSAHKNKNMLDPSTMIENKYIASGVTIKNSSNTNALLSDFVPVRAGHTYTFSHDPVVLPSVAADKQSLWIAYAFFADDDMTSAVGERTLIQNQESFSFTVPSGANYVRIGGRHMQNGATYMLEEGPVATEYEPYSSN